MRSPLRLAAAALLLGLSGCVVVPAPVPSYAYAVNPYDPGSRSLAGAALGAGTGAALGAITARTLVLGIDSDRLFPVEGQERIAAALPHGLDGGRATVIESEFGHDGFLIETPAVAGHLRRLLAD